MEIKIVNPNALLIPDALGIESARSDQIEKFIRDNYLIGAKISDIIEKLAFYCKNPNEYTFGCIYLGMFDVKARCPLHRGEIAAQVRQN